MEQFVWPCCLCQNSKHF